MQKPDPAATIRLPWNGNISTRSAARLLPAETERLVRGEKGDLDADRLRQVRGKDGWGPSRESSVGAADVRRHTLTNWSPKNLGNGVYHG